MDILFQLALTICWIRFFWWFFCEAKAKKNKKSI